MTEITQPLITTQKPQNNTTKALLYMLMGVVTMSMMNMVAKILRETTKIQVLHVSLVRTLGMVFFSYAYCQK